MTVPSRQSTGSAARDPLRRGPRRRLALPVDGGLGAAVADGRDGYLYVFGTSNPDEPMVFGWAVHVARAVPDDLTTPSACEYWTGDAWSSSPQAATEVIPAVGGVSQTFSVIERSGT
ncbi:MAG: hypothetical protein ACKO70_08375 [Actinomycetota bacterium]